MSIRPFVFDAFRVVKYTFSLLLFGYLLRASPYHEEYLAAPRTKPSTTAPLC